MGSNLVVAASIRLHDHACLGPLSDDTDTDTDGDGELGGVELDCGSSPLDPWVTGADVGRCEERAARRVASGRARGRVDSRT